MSSLVAYRLSHIRCDAPGMFDISPYCGAFRTLFSADDKIGKPRSLQVSTFTGLVGGKGYVGPMYAPCLEASDGTVGGGAYLACNTLHLCPQSTLGDKQQIRDMRFS